MSEKGLPVWYDGKKYTIFYNGKCREYPIGGLACEYSRFEPYTLKDVIMKCPVFEKILYLEEPREEAIKWFYDELFDKYDPVTAVMIMTDMTDLIHDFTCFDEGLTNDLLDELNKRDDKINNYILKDSGLEQFNVDTIGAALLTAYYCFVDSYTVFHKCLDMLANDEGEETEINMFMKFYSEHVEFQHIKYKLTLIEGKFAEIFTIQSSLSLILFEAAHILESKTQIVKCENCGHFFVPSGRSDTIYCTYPSPQDPEKTCKDIGAQIRRSNKEKTDIATKEYRKVYMRYKMLIRRHPEETKYEEQLERLKSEVKEWRKKLDQGTASTEDFLKWLNQF